MKGEIHTPFITEKGNKKCFRYCITYFIYNLYQQGMTTMKRRYNLVSVTPTCHKTKNRQKRSTNLQSKAFYL